MRCLFFVFVWNFICVFLFNNCPIRVCVCVCFVGVVSCRGTVCVCVC